MFTYIAGNLMLNSTS